MRGGYGETVYSRSEEKPKEYIEMCIYQPGGFKGFRRGGGATGGINLKCKIQEDWETLVGI